jgi:hypothetical protein
MEEDRSACDSVHYIAATVVAGALFICHVFVHYLCLAHQFIIVLFETIAIALAALRRSESVRLCVVRPWLESAASH